MWGNILTVIYVFLAASSAVPANYDSDESGEDSLVYVVNIYAVRNTNTKNVAKMLTDETLMEIPAKFESIGSVLLPDGQEEPVTMKEVQIFFETMGLSVKQLNEGDDPKVIEIKGDMSYDEIFPDLEEIAISFLNDGLMCTIKFVNNSMIFMIEYNPGMEDNRHITLEEIVEALEMEGIDVEYETVDGSIIKVIITQPFDDDSSESEESSESKESTTRAGVEGKPERKENKIERTEEKPMPRKNELDDQFKTLGFTTRSEALNKIRRRRSECQGCRAIDTLKTYLQEHSHH
ncbi:uncharacterized protein [Fopius arisanus]|uniref:Os11g0592800 protein n=1 Tax=Fopius arisanus TaxID=64838 RepID=A0A0C9QPT7_9HYME|nr:PREDICTED: uncharacterized protein LOC105267977 [Fopius arisanus]